MGWLTGWSYRKAIVIAHTADGAQTNYQMKLLVGESSGATGENIDCDGLVASDFDDLRFTTSDGSTLCDYWIESLSGTTPNQLATVWIEVPSIAAHPDDTTIYMYYGNSSATAASNGINTFIFFDDFSSGDTSKWTEETNGGTISAATNQLVLNAIANKPLWNGVDAATKVYKAITPTSFAAYCKVVSFSPAANYDMASMGIRKDANNWVDLNREYATVQSIYSQRCNAGTSDTVANAAFTPTTNFYLKIAYLAGTSYFYYSTDNSSWTTLGSYALTLSTRQLMLLSCSGSASNPPAATFDNVYVTNTTANEPTWSSFGKMEAIQSITNLIKTLSAKSKRFKAIRKATGAIKENLKTPISKEINLSRKNNAAFSEIVKTPISKIFNSVRKIISDIILTVKSPFEYDYVSGGGANNVEELSSILFLYAANIERLINLNRLITSIGILSGILSHNTKISIIKICQVLLDCNSKVFFNTIRFFNIEKILKSDIEKNVGFSIALIAQSILYQVKSFSINILRMFSSEINLAISKTYLGFLRYFQMSFILRISSIGQYIVAIMIQMKMIASKTRNIGLSKAISFVLSILVSLEKNFGSNKNISSELILLTSLAKTKGSSAIQSVSIILDNILTKIVNWNSIKTSIVKLENIFARGKVDFNISNNLSLILNSMIEKILSYDRTISNLISLISNLSGSGAYTFVANFVLKSFDLVRRINLSNIFRAKIILKALEAHFAKGFQEMIANFALLVGAEKHFWGRNKRIEAILITKANDLKITRGIKQIIKVSEILSAEISKTFSIIASKIASLILKVSDLASLKIKVRLISVATKIISSVTRIKSTSHLFRVNYIAFIGDFRRIKKRLGAKWTRFREYINKDYR